MNLLEQQKVVTLEADPRYMAEILPIRRKPLSNQSINQSIRYLNAICLVSETHLPFSKEKFIANFVNGQASFRNIENTEIKKENDDSISPVPQRQRFNPYASEFRQYSHSGVATDLAQFLSKKDFLLSRFSAFIYWLAIYETSNSFFHNLSSMRWTWHYFKRWTSRLSDWHVTKTGTKRFASSI